MPFAAWRYIHLPPYFVNRIANSCKRIRRSWAISNNLKINKLRTESKKKKKYTLRSLLDRIGKGVCSQHAIGYSDLVQFFPVSKLHVIALALFAGSLRKIIRESLNRMWSRNISSSSSVNWTLSSDQVCIVHLWKYFFINVFWRNKMPRRGRAAAPPPRT